MDEYMDECSYHLCFVTSDALKDSPGIGPNLTYMLAPSDPDGL